MKRTLLFVFGALCLTIMFSSFHDGAGLQAGDCSGGHAPQSCAWGAGCHNGGGVGITTLTIEIRDSLSGALTTRYEPNKTYFINITGNNPWYSKFGYQLTSLTDSLFQAGNLQSDTNSHIVTFFASTMYQYQVLEQNQPLSQNINSQFRVSTIWHSPVSLVGNITFYAALNAVDMDGSPFGDNPTSAQLALSPMPTATQETNTNFKLPDVFPNPASTFLFVTNTVPMQFDIQLINSNGECIFTKTHYGGEPIPTSCIPNGVYFLKLINNGMVDIKKVIILH